MGYRPKKIDFAFKFEFFLKKSHQYNFNLIVSNYDLKELKIKLRTINKKRIKQNGFQEPSAAKQLPIFFNF